MEGDPVEEVLEQERQGGNAIPEHGRVIGHLAKQWGVEEVEEAVVVGAWEAETAGARGAVLAAVVVGDMN